MTARRTEKFNVRLDPRLDMDIRALADELDVDKSEIARRALSLYLIAKRRAMANGETISMVKDGQQTVELVGV